MVEQYAAKSGQKLNWRTSIVDLLKALNIDSSLAARKKLSEELGFDGDNSDSAAMNIRLHKRVMQKLAENGGRCPTRFRILERARGIAGGRGRPAVPRWPKSSRPSVRRSPPRARASPRRWRSLSRRPAVAKPRGVTMKRQDGDDIRSVEEHLTLLQHAPSRTRSADELLFKAFRQTKEPVQAGASSNPPSTFQQLIGDLGKELERLGPLVIDSVTGDVDAARALHRAAGGNRGRPASRGPRRALARRQVVVSQAVVLGAAQSPASPTAQSPGERNSAALAIASFGDRREKTHPVLALLPTLILAADKSPDQSFHDKAAEGGTAEVELGKLAQQKAQSPAVKEFGAMMVKDHSMANEKLKAVASKKGVELPKKPGIGQMATKAKLEVLSGETFDKSYVKGMIEDHEEDIEEFEKEAKDGRDADARALRRERRRRCART